MTMDTPDLFADLPEPNEEATAPLADAAPDTAAADDEATTDALAESAELGESSELSEPSELSTPATDANEPPPPDLPTSTPEIDDGSALPLDSYAERAYLAYAMSVVKSRALPQVEDGLKPVQRRILFSMNEMRLNAASKHVKSARVVGDVIGKYHPHGDSSVYDAMVRVAQDFSLRYPLVDGQGNFGSRDGDGAAAMRYTECRLTPIASLLLDEIDRGTVDFAPNYDGAFQEPTLLPARLPFVLLNGASGIAVGMATEIPPHNLREVASAACLLIEKPDAQLDEVLSLLPGPDFPGGGQLISQPGDVREAYATGRGSLRMQAKWHVEDQARGQWRVIVDELPHGVSTANVLAEIETLTNPQPKTGKKDISQEQKNLKQVVLGLLESVRDESSEKAPIRIVLEPRSSRISQQEFMAVLLAHTSLASSVSLNMTMIGLNGRPQQKNLVQILREWGEFRIITVERRSRHRLDEVERRIHILEGRKTVFLRIDEVIRVIRESDEPKPELMAAFGLSEIQAEDILEIRLRQLARLEGFKIDKELGDLETERGELATLLSNRNALTRLVLREIREDAKKFGDDRRTLIEAVAPAAAAADMAVPDEPVTIILSRNGFVRSRQGHGIAVDSITYKTGDTGFAVLETRTIWPLILIDDKGRAYSIKASDLPGGRGDGVPMSTLIELQDGGKIAQVLSAAPEDKFLVASDAGYGFVTSVSDLISRNKAGKAFLTLDAGESPLPPAPVKGETASTLCALSALGRLLMFPVADMPTLGKGRGNKIIDLEKGDKLLALAVNDGSSLTISGTKRNGTEDTATLSSAALAPFQSVRARKGHFAPIKLKVSKIG